MTTVAVTGASGFVGRYVVAELARRSLSPVLISRYGSTTPPAAGIAVQMDVHDPPADAFDRIGKPDVVIHLAWGGLPNYKSSHHFDRESPAHFQFLKRLLDSGLRHLVVAGTCYEYGMQSGPLHEDLEARPVTAYGLGKDILRRLLERSVTGESSLTWARLFYPYGEGQAATSLWPQLKRAAERGDPTFDMSPGEQLRDYLPVEDVARHIVALALADKGCGVVNICSGQPTSIRALAERWIREQGWSIALNLGRYPYPDYEPMAFWGNPRKLHRVLGLA